VFIAMALFAGRDNVAAVQRYAQFLTQAQRAWLGFPRKKGTSFRKVPSYSALRNLLIRIDPHQLADCLNRWLQANLGTLPRALALDGKWIRDRALSLCLSEHQSGAPVAMGFAKQKTQDDQQQSKDDYKREGEHTVALRLYATTNLQKLQPQLQPLGPAHLPDRAQGGPSPRGFLARPAGALPEQSPNPFPDTRQAPLQMKRPWWVPSRPKFLVHVHPLADHYRTLFRQGLQRDAPDLLKTLPARVWKQRWVVHCQPAGSGEAALRYLSRYVFKTSTSPSAQRAGK
jgi:hypothetical protein